MKARLERILTKLANHYTPALLAQAHGDDRLRRLADGLAREGVLVIAGRVPARVTAQQVIDDWVAAYYDLHQLLTKKLFPTHTRLDVTDGDGQHPPVFVLHSDVCAVTKAIGGYVVPFVAGQQQQGQFYLSHLKGIMTYLIHDLEGGDLPTTESNELAENGVLILQRLLKSVVQQEALTSPNREIVRHIQQMPPPPPPFLPESGQQPSAGNNSSSKPPEPIQNQAAAPERTQTTPEIDIQDEPPVEPTATEEMFVPIFFKRPKNGKSGANGQRRNRRRADD